MLLAYRKSKFSFENIRSHLTFVHGSRRTYLNVVQNAECVE